MTKGPPALEEGEEEHSLIPLPGEGESTPGAGRMKLALGTRAAGPPRDESELQTNAFPGFQVVPHEQLGLSRHLIARSATLEFADLGDELARLAVEARLQASLGGSQAIVSPHAGVDRQQGQFVRQISGQNQGKK